ncbi:MAG: 50S ribosomal protein L4 [Deltaproteobacteria bacterium]|nr:50S ribosomal protein L4 [Deltaproteobacteria bacterium]
MAQFDIYNLKREKVGEIDLCDSVFNAEVKPHLFWEVVRWQLAKRRRGTAKVKERHEVRGGGKKPYRQKGTGRARQGSERAPNFVGGGKVFGPKPKDYGYTLPRKVKQGALRSALSLRAQEQKLLIVDSFDLEAPRTKGLVQVLGVLGTPSVLIVDGANDNLSLSSRNLYGVKYLPGGGLNVFDILKHDQLIMTRASAMEIEGRLKR